MRWETKDGTSFVPKEPEMSIWLNEQASKLLANIAQLEEFLLIQHSDTHVVERIYELCKNELEARKALVKS